MKVGDSVFTKHRGDIIEAKIIKIGNKYYYIEWKYLHNEHKKVSIKDNRSMSQYNRLQFYLNKEELEDKEARDVIQKTKSYTAFIIEKVPPE